jgi:hypothetical protein
VEKGYFEERPGVKSMSRLVAFMAAVGICSIVAAIAFAIIHAFVHPAEGLADSLTGIIASAAGLVSALGAGAWGALRDRNRGRSSPMPEPKADAKRR